MFKLWVITLFLAFSLNSPGPDHIIIPSIDLSQPIYPTGLKDLGNNQLIWVTLPNDVGWHYQSSLPGEGNNIVLNGHSNILGRVFKNLHLVKIGDQISVYDNSIEYQYIVKAIIIVEEKGMPWQVRLKNAKWIEPTEDERVTLITCLDENKFRLIIVAFPKRS